MIGGFPPKLPPREEWISLCSALTWLQCNHALELDELLEWASQAWIPEREIRQILTDQWQQLIDHGWAKEIQLKAEVTGHNCHERIRSERWRPFRYVEWRSTAADGLLLSNHSVSPGDRAATQNGDETRTLNDPQIYRADVIQFKKVRGRRRDANRTPDYVGAERDLRWMLSRHEKQTGLKWGYIEELVEIHGLPEYQAVRMWTQITKDLGFPQHGRPRESRDKNSRQ